MDTNGLNPAAGDRLGWRRAPGRMKASGLAYAPSHIDESGLCCSLMRSGAEVCVAIKCGRKRFVRDSGRDPSSKSRWAVMCDRDPAASDFFRKRKSCEGFFGGPEKIGYSGWDGCLRVPS